MLPFLVNYENFSVLITPTSSNSGSPRVAANGSFTVQSILKLENTSKIHLSHGELHGTSAKRECDGIVNEWKMIFQASDDKGRNFLDLVDDDNNPLELSYSKGSTWLQYFGHSNSLCA